VDTRYDVIIVGGGPAGLTAGIYASRARLATLLVEKLALGGQVNSSEKIENYPGFEQGISGIQLISNLEKQAKGFGLKVEIGTAQELTLLNNHTKKIQSNGKALLCKALIIATGSEPYKLGVEGEERLIGRGVSYCATCDGPFFRNKDIAVVGGGDAAVEEALFLSKFAQRVYIIHRRDQLRAIKILQERASAKENISFIWNTVVEKIEGEQTVTSVCLKNLKDTRTSTLKVDGMFIYVGLRPNTSWLKRTLTLTEQGFIETNEQMETSLPGVFAAGDVRNKLLRQIATAIGDGSTAAFAAEKYLESLKP
jgi:thioredoxin reductase (NADPH)